MDIHYFLRNKTSYLAVFIKYAFSENKNRILQHFKVYQENIEPKRIQNNQIRNVISIFTDGRFMYLLQPVFEVSKCKVSVDHFMFLNIIIEMLDSITWSCGSTTVSLMCLSSICNFLICPAPWVFSCSWASALLTSMTSRYLLLASTQ